MPYVLFCAKKNVSILIFRPLPPHLFRGEGALAPLAAKPLSCHAAPGGVGKFVWTVQQGVSDRYPGAGGQYLWGKSNSLASGVSHSSHLENSITRHCPNSRKAAKTVCSINLSQDPTCTLYRRGIVRALRTRVMPRFCQGVNSTVAPHAPRGNCL